MMNLINPLDDAGLLFKGVSEISQNEAKEQEGGFLLYY